MLGYFDVGYGISKHVLANIEVLGNIDVLGYIDLGIGEETQPPSTVSAASNPIECTAQEKAVPRGSRGPRAAVATAKGRDQRRRDCSL